MLGGRQPVVSADLTGCPRWADIRGKKTIVEEWIKMMGDFHGPEGEPAVCTFICLPGRMKVTGDTAAARSYTTEMFTDVTGATRETKGQYDDKFVKQKRPLAVQRTNLDLVRDRRPHGYTRLKPDRSGSIQHVIAGHAVLWCMMHAAASRSKRGALL